MDVQLEDAGEYECQVTPVPANNHPLLRRKTELIVLIKPSVPSILYPDVPPLDRQLIISKPDPILRITVLCVSVGGSPPPNFSWSLNNQEIPQIRTTPSPRRMSHVQNPWMKLEPMIETQPETGQSRLTLLKSGLKDGDQLMCSVTNAATQLHHDPHQRNLSTHVTIRVHTPPGPPRIISPETDHVYLEGDELKAICVASPPGNPLGGLFWRWLLHPVQVNDPSIGHVSGLGGRGGARLSDYSSVEAYVHAQDVGYSLGEKSGTTGPHQTLTPISEDVQPLHYTLNKDKDQLVNTLVIPRITRRYHASKLVCETGHPVGTAHQTSINIYVKHPPANVTISIDGGTVRQEIAAGRREYVVYGRAGEMKTIVCRTGPYYRDAQIKWVAQGPDPGLLKAPRELFGQTKTIQTSDGYSRVQESRVNVTITEADDRGYIDCRVWGEGDTRMDARVRLDIIYPPTKPTVSGYKSLDPIKMAHTLELVCTTYGGNPPPELAWFKDNQQILSTSDVVVLGRQSSLKLKVIPQKEDNGAHYHCSSRNAATGPEGIRSESVILNVLFPPERIVISFHSPPVVSSGHQLVINCQAGTSNPVATISWWHFRCGPAHAFTQSLVSSGQKKSNAGRTPTENTKCKSVAMQGTNEKPTPGAHGGLQANSRLWLRPTWHYHMDYIECRTENSEYGPPVWHDRLQLNITFAPQFLGLQAGTEKVVREGQSMSLDLGPYANPPVTAVNWFINGVPLLFEPSDTKEAEGVFASGRNGELLALHRIKRKHMANYTVMATNPEAESKAVFFLNVTYPAELIGSTVDNITDSVNGVASFECTAEANPAVAIRSFTWYRFVPPKSWPEDSHEAAMQLGSPIPCNESASAPGRTDKLFVSCQQESQLRMSSRLSLYRVTEDDVGTYVCEVNNGLGEPVQKRVNFLHPCESGANSLCGAVNLQGEATLDIQMSGTSTPDVPLNLRLLNATMNTLKVAWTQGFDGGLSQTFQVRWRQAETGTLQPGTEYTISVNSMNSKHGASAFTEPIHVRTEFYDDQTGKALRPPLSSSGHSDDNALLIIVAACVFGFVVFVINLIVIAFLLKRRRQRRHLAQQRKIRSDDASNLTMTNGFALVQSNQQFDHTEHLGPKSMFKSSEDPITASFISDSAGGCMCCTETRHKPTNSNFGHSTTNQHIPGYNLTHSYHNSGTADRGQFSPLDTNASRQINLTETSGMLYGTQASASVNEPLLSAHHQPRLVGQTIYNQYTPRQSSGPTRHAGTLRSPSSLSKIKPDTVNDLPGGSTLPRHSTSITITNPAVLYNGHGKRLDFQEAITDSLDPGTAVMKSGGCSTQILSTGLAAFSTHKTHSANPNNSPPEGTITTNLEAANQPIYSQQLVSIKKPDSAGSFVTTAAPTSPLPSNFYDDASLEYALSSPCTPLLLSLDTGTQLQFASPNPILMSTDPNTARGTSYSTGYYDFDGALTAAPILVQAQSHLTYTHPLTLEKSEDGDRSTS
ncbi:putative nephrin [Fasciola gigantica]|uniref:Putative nephrin n=1 Tax=Fasciola gigantica TaxID=46835 RepID=A0A504Y9V9_FASGI|nr:putative nephrin [Fasciola gigantica]